MNNIGYRVKLNDYLDTKTHYKSFLEEYFELFNAIEVKINKYLINCNDFDNYIKYLLDTYREKVSFHFNKSLLNVGLNEKEKMIIDYLTAQKYSISCISHLSPNIMDIDDIESIEQLSYKFNKNTILTLENPETKEDILTYLENISEVFHKLEEENIKLNLCIDWGHILINNRDIDLVFNKIRKEDLLKYVSEYHIHNIKDGCDHQPIYNGEIDCNEIYKLISKHNDKARIILECEVNKMQQDGLDNIKLLTKK